MGPSKSLEETEKELDAKVAFGELTPEEADMEYFDRMEWDYGLFIY